MPLRVLAGPGCDAVGKDEYLEDAREAGDVVISVGRIFKALTGSSGVPSENPPALRLALGLRSAAIRSANVALTNHARDRAESSGRFLKPGAWRPTVKKFSYRARRSSRQRASSCDAGIAAKRC